MPRILIALSIVMVLAACSTATSLTVSESLTKEAALAQLDALKPLPGADPETFQQLKEAMRRSLLASHTTRYTSTLPGGAAGTVADLQLSSDGGSTSLGWTYANRADYDQNRQVNIADLSALGANMGKGTASPDWLTKACVADGDQNGLVTISDITPIGASLLATVDGYWVQSSTTPSDAGSWTDLGQATFEEAILETGSPFKHFSFVIDNPQPGTYYRVRPYSGEELGPVSNYVQLEDGPPTIDDVQPQNGDSGEVITFEATVSGSPPEGYAWDFGGAAVPNTTIDPSPTVTLGTAGVYNASLTVTSALGDDTYNFTLTVGSTVSPPHIDDVQPQTGYGGGGHITLTATLSGGAPDTYAWDFGAPGGEITPNTSSEATPEVVLGQLGAYNASLTVGNAGGTDTFNFVLSVTSMPTPPEAPYAFAATDGEYPDYVHLSWVPSPNGNIADDFEVYRADTAGGPFTSIGITSDSTLDDFVPVRNVQYWYYVIARKNQVAQSAPSNTDSGYAYNGLPGSWHTTTVPGVSESVATEAVLIDCNGKPAIARRGIAPFYYAQWIKAQDSQGTTWNTPIELSSSLYGDFADLAKVNGKPAILFNKAFDFPPGAFYMSANDEDATSWGIPQQCWSTSLAGTPRLAEVNGQPAFTFGDGPLNFLRANDASGTSWPVTPIQMHVHQNNGSRLGFFPDGSPFSFASWVDGGTNYYTEFIFAGDPAGETWDSVGVYGQPLDSDNLYFGPVFYSGGKPWLGAIHETVGSMTLGVMFAGNAQGSSWPSGITEIPGSDGRASNYFAVINGRPCVLEATGSSGSYMLWFHEASDNAATAWNTPEAVLSSPAISFMYLTGIGTPQRPMAAIMSGSPNFALVFAERY